MYTTIRPEKFWCDTKGEYFYAAIRKAPMGATVSVQGENTVIQNGKKSFMQGDVSVVIPAGESVLIYQLYKGWLRANSYGY